MAVRNARPCRSFLVRILNLAWFCARIQHHLIRSSYTTQLLIYHKLVVREGSQALEGQFFDGYGRFFGLWAVFGPDLHLTTNLR